MKLLYSMALLFLFAGMLKEGPGTVFFPIRAEQECTSTDFQYVDTIVAAFLDKTEIAGVSVSANKAGAIIYSKGFGYADVERKIKMKPTSQIRTASVAKVITATALGKLASDGKLDLDAPLKEYIPYVRAPYATLTARQIAGHTAGVQHRPSSRKIQNKHYTEVRETVAFFEDAPLLFEPDTDYRYSTLGYNLLAALIEEVSGKRYVDYMKEDIFIPLNMTQTFPEEKSVYSEADAKLYHFKGGKLRLDEKIQDGSYKLAGAGFRSTSVDLAKMMNAYSNGFLSDEVVQTMFTSAILNNGKRTNVGVGWRLNRDMNYESTIEHAGSWQGARTVIVYYPERKLTVSMMINTKCTIFIEETAQLIARFFLDEPPSDMELAGLGNAVEITNNRSDGTVETYPGELTFIDNKKGELRIETDRDWLKKNAVYYLSSDSNFVLSTQYGLLYLKLRLQPKLEGKLFQYQFLDDKYHMNQQPMLYIQPKE